MMDWFESPTPQNSTFQQRSRWLKQGSEKAVGSQAGSIQRIQKGQPENSMKKAITKTCAAVLGQPPAGRRRAGLPHERDQGCFFR